MGWKCHKLYRSLIMMVYYSKCPKMQKTRKLIIVCHGRLTNPGCMSSYFTMHPTSAAVITGFDTTSELPTPCHHWFWHTQPAAFPRWSTCTSVRIAGLPTAGRSPVATECVPELRELLCRHRLNQPKWQASGLTLAVEIRACCHPPLMKSTSAKAAIADRSHYRHHFRN